MGLAFIILAALGGTAYVVHRKLVSSDNQDSLLVTSKLYSGSGKTNSSNVDKGLSPAEKLAFDWALAHEKDGKKLREFGQVMLPDFPIASSVLLSRSGTSIYRGRPVGRLNPNGPITKVAAVPLTATQVKTQAAIQSGLTFRGIAHGESAFGSIFDVDNYTDAVSDVAHAIAHPADTVEGAWHAVTHPADSITDFANASVNIVHGIPGIDYLGEQLKDFARTGFGEWCFRIMATCGYYVMAPYLGAQMAAISFALPGVMKVEPFMASWIKETIDRVIKTAQILLANQVKFPDLGNATSEQVNKFLADNPAVKAMVEQATVQIGTATQVLKAKLGEEITSRIEQGVAGALEDAKRELEQEYGLPPDFAKMANEAGIQEINAAAAYDLIAHTNYQGTVTWDAATGIDILAHMKAQRMGGVQSARTTTRAGQMAIDALNAEYRAKRPIVVQYYVNQSRG